MAKPLEYLRRGTEHQEVVNFYPYCSGGDEHIPAWSNRVWTATKPIQSVFADAESITPPTKLTPQQEAEHSRLCFAKVHTIQFNNGFRLVEDGVIHL